MEKGGWNVEVSKAQLQQCRQSKTWKVLESCTHRAMSYPRYDPTRIRLKHSVWHWSVNVFEACFLRVPCLVIKWTSYVFWVLYSVCCFSWASCKRASAFSFFSYLFDCSLVLGNLWFSLLSSPAVLDAVPSSCLSSAFVMMCSTKLVKSSSASDCSLCAGVSQNLNGYAHRAHRPAYLCQVCCDLSLKQVQRAETEPSDTQTG